MKLENIVRAAPPEWRRDLLLLQNYLQTLETCGGLYTQDALCIVDLAPGNGERAWQLLRSLPVEAFKVHYLAACLSGDDQAGLSHHPVLQELQQSGRLSILKMPYDETEWRSVLPTTRNPMLIFAHDLFSGLPQAQYACHYGKWLQAFPESVNEPWQEMPVEDRIDQLLAPAYLQSINSCSLLIPSAAIALLEPLIAAALGRYLLVSSDMGVSELAEIRLGALQIPPPIAASAARLPVNFHALGLWQKMMGAACGHAWNGLDKDRTLQLALRDEDFPQMLAQLPALLATCNATPQAESILHELATRLAELIKLGQADVKQAFALWQAAEYSPEIMLPLAEALIDEAGAVEGPALHTWRKALQQSCRCYFPDEINRDFHRLAACMAAALGIWNWAILLLQTGSELYGHSIASLRLHAHCLQMVGSAEEALELLEQALLAAPEQADMREDYHALRQRTQRWENLPWFSSEIAAAEGLRLEPLGIEHASVLHYQYRDPQIGLMARLPAFLAVEEVAAWIGERCQDKGRMEFALIHDELGFAGVLSAHCVDKNAFFHFWIGTDFQGQGLALPALRLLLAQMKRSGLERIFTTVYPDNSRSLRVIKHAGFRPLPDRALPPEENMPFFCLELGKKSARPEELSKALRDYSARSGGVFEFADALQPSFQH